MGALKVVIEDECLAAWMVINNTFTAKHEEQWHSVRQFWDGVMIQLGEYELVKQHQGSQIACRLQSVLFKRADSLVREIERDAFLKNTIWINVVAGQIPVADDPMQKKHLQDIFPDDVKTLHRYLKPFKGGITIWQLRGRAKGFDLAARQDSNGALHNRFTFEFDLGPKFRIEIHGLPKGTDVGQTPDQPPFLPLEGIDEIVIQQMEKSPGHGDGNNPPQLP